MIEAFVISFIIALVRKGSIKAWALLDLGGTEWIFAGAIMQYGALYLAGRDISFFVMYGPWFFIASFFPLLYGVWASRRLPGLRWVGVGLILNMIVITANGGSMPVNMAVAERVGLEAVAEPLQDARQFRHQPMDASTRLWFLGDVIPIPPPYPRAGVASIGDLLMVFGVFVLVQRTMVEPGRSRGPTHA